MYIILCDVGWRGRDMYICDQCTCGGDMYVCDQLLLLVCCTEQKNGFYILCSAGIYVSSIQHSIWTNGEKL